MSTFFFKLQGRGSDRTGVGLLLQRHGFRQGRQGRGWISLVSVSLGRERGDATQPPGCARWVMDPTNKPRTRKASGSYAGPAAKKGYQSKQKKSFAEGLGRHGIVTVSGASPLTEEQRTRIATNKRAALQIQRHKQIEGSDLCRSSSSQHNANDTGLQKEATAHRMVFVVWTVSVCNVECFDTSKEKRSSACHPSIMYTCTT